MSVPNFSREKERECGVGREKRGYSLEPRDRERERERDRYYYIYRCSKGGERGMDGWMGWVGVTVGKFIIRTKSRGRRRKQPKNRHLALSASRLRFLFSLLRMWNILWIFGFYRNFSIWPLQFYILCLADWGPLLYYLFCSLFYLIFSFQVQTLGLKFKLLLYALLD